MTVADCVHALDVRDQIDAIFTDIVEAADEGRHIDRHLGAFRGSVDGGRLRLREAQGDVDPDIGADRLLSGAQALAGTGLFF